MNIYMAKYNLFIINLIIEKFNSICIIYRYVCICSNGFFSSSIVPFVKGDIFVGVNRGLENKNVYSLILFVIVIVLFYRKKWT